LFIANTQNRLTDFLTSSVNVQHVQALKQFMLQAILQFLDATRKRPKGGIVQAIALQLKAGSN
jgi:hypothetical protein